MKAEFFEKEVVWNYPLVIAIIQKEDYFGQVVGYIVDESEDFIDLGVELLADGRSRQTVGVLKRNIITMIRTGITFVPKEKT